MKTLRRHLVGLPLAGLLALVLPGLSFAVEPQDSFIVSQHGQSVGTASYRFTPTSEGYSSTSLVRVSMQGLNYAFSKTERLTSSNQLRHVQLSAIINNSAVNVSAAPDAAQLLLNISANGRSTTTRLDAHSSAVFMPDFDPGALETLLTVAATNNNRGVWAILPKQAGSVAPVTLATYADEQGTLDGKPIAVHHLVATIDGAKTDIFSGPQSQLLQAELPQEGFALVRRGFELKPPAKPIAPPADSTPPAH